MTKLPANVIAFAMVRFSHLATGSRSKTAQHGLLAGCRRESTGTALHNTQLVLTVVFIQCLVLP